ncbi:MAG TPA: hypothetical protein VK574_14740 [Terracidiphilus sp.]|nr:hypothetical protein [Terracidiphilus sp.]
MRFLIFAGLLAACVGVAGQEPANSSAPDSDHDGLSDVQEQALLEQFAPRFMISRDDCSTQPAEFEPSVLKPVVAAENSTIYGQAFPRAGHAEQIELHYYDLWRKDCGQRGHNLDAEHVSALLERDNAGTWMARYWYAAAHEDTLCDASQITRAKTLKAESHGPELWISSGKHAAFLSQTICSRGCGADRCGNEERLSISNLINVGEPSAPMNGSTWTGSPEWPLADKLGRSDFGDARIARLDRMGPEDIAWASPKKRPAQAAILGGDDAIAGVGMALTTADSSTSGALNTASGKTGSALGRAYRGVKRALRGSVRAVEGK